MNAMRHLIRQTKWYKRIRLQVFREADYRCFYCGVSCTRRQGLYAPVYPTLDHKRPIARGGNWSRSNLVCACRRCNEAKGDMTVKEFVERESA
jgi:5-methylcytosine-specific restriction endonuclease McrA